ncbi:MAG: glycosyltransferase [Coleofasciculaceae cyanobacterium]
MNNPLVSIIIPTYNRPQLLPRAVKSALAQTIDDLEVIVIDDASTEPVNLPEQPRLRIIRLPENRGIAAVRNVGAKNARGRWLTYLDDDDQLLPQMVEVSLKAVSETKLPKPVAILSGLEVVNQEGKVIQRRIPPTLPCGKHFFLEEVNSKESFLSKQTLMIEREVLLGIGGYDEELTSREHTEMFLRLNPVCSLLGVPTVAYRQFRHEGPRLSGTQSLRQVDFNYLVDKHKSLFLAHPKMFANFVYEHALKSYELGQLGPALSNFLWALQLHPRHVLGRVTWSYRKGLKRRIKFISY